MANLGFSFNAAEVEPQQSFDPIPAGEYVAAIVESEMKTTHAGTGQYLSLTLEVLDGQYKGRKLFDRLNLNNPNPKAVSIAMSTLSAISHAVGVLNVSDSAQLHGKPMVVKVKVREADGQYDASNEIKAYKATTAKPTAAAAPAAHGKPSAPAWAQ